VSKAHANHEAIQADQALYPVVDIGYFRVQSGDSQDVSEKCIKAVEKLIKVFVNRYEIILQSTHCSSLGICDVLGVGYELNILAQNKLLVNPLMLKLGKKRLNLGRFRIKVG